jgi:hypothetical protein
MEAHASRHAAAASARASWLTLAASMLLAWQLDEFRHSGWHAGFDHACN